MSRAIRNRLLLGVLLCIIIYIGWYFLTLKSLTITYQNAHDVTVYKTSALDAGKGLKPVAKLRASGQTVKLRGGFYTIHYNGNAGYDSRYVEIHLLDKHQSAQVKPEYSSDHLQALLNQEFAAISSVIVAKYPNINLYTIQPGKLYRDGEWYGTTLRYHGHDIYNTDTLRIVLQKENGLWVVKTTPPDISLSKFLYPDVPVDILRDVNNQP